MMICSYCAQVAGLKSAKLAFFNIRLAAWIYTIVGVGGVCSPRRRRRVRRIPDEFLTHT